MSNALPEIGQILGPNESLLLFLPRPSNAKNLRFMPLFGVCLGLVLLGSILGIFSDSGRALVAAVLLFLLAVYLFWLIIRTARSSYLLTSDRIVQLVGLRPALSFHWKDCQQPSIWSPPPRNQKKENLVDTTPELARFVQICLKEETAASLKRSMTGLDHSKMSLSTPNSQYTINQILQTAQSAWKAGQ